MISLLSMALIFQVADLSFKLGQLNEYFTQPKIIDEFDSPFWDEVAIHYKKLVFLPYLKQPQSKIANFKNYIHFAALHHIKVNIGYFAREDTGQFINENRRLLREAMLGKLATDTIYVIIKPQIAMTLKNNSASIDKKEKIGRYLLIAPVSIN